MFSSGKLFGTKACWMGGCLDAERKRLFFLPSYLSEEGFLAQEKEASDYIVSLRISPIGGKFAIPLTHRDYLGAIMGLGIKRDALGDLRVENNAARVFALPNIAKEIKTNLTLVKTESVAVTEEKLFSPGFALSYEEEVVSLPSLRLDALLSGAFPLSRTLAKKHLEEGNVTFNGSVATKADVMVQEGDVISLRGKGKIRLMGEEGTSRKGRILLRIRRYL